MKPIRRYSRKSTGARVAVGAIIEEKGKVLLTKRSALIPQGNKWSLPGGRVNFGETAEKALRRELKEETGLSIKKSSFLFYVDEFFPEINLSTVVLLFKAKVEGKARFNFEVKEMKWFTKKEIENMDLAFTHKDIIKRYFERRKR